jgi:hypothetical protein
MTHVRTFIDYCTATMPYLVCVSQPITKRRIFRSASGKTNPCDLRFGTFDNSDVFSTEGNALITTEAALWPQE